MRPPPIPENEAKRIEALRKLEILDTVAEERFDRYTRLVKRIFNVPIALVSLVDTNRQWFKSRQGLDAIQTSRDASFCGHAIIEEGMFIVPDTLEDERFRDNPLVTSDPHIRFYAGYPLAEPNGYRIGTLCIIDRKPRRFEAHELESLSDIGELVARELASFRLAHTDALTGISNRRGLELLARKVRAVCERASQPIAVMMIDMDGFKSINDEYGHAQGDKALIEFANLLISIFRESDVIARLSGDEFCVLLAGADEAQAKKALDRLCSEVERRNLNSHNSYRLAFSAGVSAYSADRHDCLMRLLDDADSRMYACKRNKSCGVVSD